MNNLEKGILLILKSSITGEKYTLPDDFEINQAMPYLFMHSAASMAYIGAVNCGADKLCPAMRELFSYYGQSMLASEHQMYDIKRIYEAFDNNGIDYMPVKGCNMKHLYPAPEMRSMGDADILIREEQYPEVCKVMESIGFTFEREGPHDYSWDSAGLHVELHYKLIRQYTDAYMEYFGSGWNLAVPVSAEGVAGGTGFAGTKGTEGGTGFAATESAEIHDGSHRFVMKPEDEFIYTFIHYTKHYRLGGIGIRHVMDLWIFKRSHPEMDMDYIRDIVSRLSVREFFENTMNLIDVWFNDAKSTDKTDFMTDFIFASGNFGTAENSELAAGVKAAQQEDSVARGKVRVVLNALFPPLDNLKHRYTVLKKWPILLPVMWVWRWIDAAVNRRDNVKSLTGNVAGICKSDTSEYEKKLAYVGLDFRFDEAERKDR